MIKAPLFSSWMNVPPKYADLGKECKDLLEKDFPFDVKKVEINTIAPNAVNFIVTGSQDAKTGQYCADLKTKYVHMDSGVALTEKWTSDNMLSAEVEANNTFASGLKLKLETQYWPNTSQNAVKVSSGYLQEYVHTNVAVDVFKGPQATADLTVGMNGAFLGGEVGYNTNSASIDKYAVGAAFYRPDYNLSVHARNMFNVFSTSYYHRVSPNLATGCTATWDRLASDRNQAVFFEFASYLRLQGEAATKIKLDSLGRVTLSYIQRLAPSIVGTLAAHVDTKKSDKDACKVGFSLVFNA